MGCPSAPASIRRRGRFAEHGGLERALLACWSWTEGFWNVPGPGAERSETLFPRRQQCDQLRRCAFLGRALGAQPAEACLPSPPPFHLSPSLLTLGESPQARGGHSSLSPTAGEVAWHSCAQGNEFAGGSSFLTKPWGPEGWG